jgi:hypothetical protein
MLGTKQYTKQYMDECRERVERAVAAYRELPAKPGDGFEALYFNNLVLLLDYFFVHRLRMVAGKDGNPLNEVRILCNSILANDSIFTAENVAQTSAFEGLTGIKLPPDKSVLKLSAGDAVRLTEHDFVRLSHAFFDEMERKFL